MKKYLLIALSLFLTIGFVSCGDDEDDSCFDGFNYAPSQLVGTWVIKQYSISKDGLYINWKDVETGATFNRNGTYSGYGSFGNGNGTFKATGNIVQTYVSGQPYIQYEVFELNGNKAKLSLTGTGSSKIYVICYKN